MTKPTSKGFIRRIAERIGLAQKEVTECRGKSLSEMAEMTSKKDVVAINATKAESIRELEGYISKQEEELNKLNDEIIKKTHQYGKAYQEGPIKIHTIPDSDFRQTMERESYDAFKTRLEKLDQEIKTLQKRYESQYRLVNENKAELQLMKGQVAKTQKDLL